ncbi:LytR C-terminal domain-containing protein [Nocardioides sp.]|uniref:LytR C-terminal domain-containing protein n=1 Tax=Nocardioides sp. TaxID=35761 RepID=UPI0035278E8C
MPRGVKTALTLTALVALVVVGGMWGWAAFTEPFPQRSAQTTACTDTTLAAGTSLTPEKMLVDVFNASDRVGLASRTSEELTSAGFAVGRASDAPDGTKVKVAEIWTTDPQGPEAKLLRSYLGKRARITNAEPLDDGVTLVLGPKFKQVTKGKKSLELAEDTTVCVPPAPE